MFSNINKNNVGQYFSERKHRPSKDIKGKVDREKWLAIKEYAMFKGCPESLVEDAMIQFVADVAYDAARCSMETPEFRQWSENKMKKRVLMREKRVSVGNNARMD